MKKTTHLLFASLLLIVETSFGITYKELQRIIFNNWLKAPKEITEIVANQLYAPGDYSLTKTGEFCGDTTDTLKNIKEQKPNIVNLNALPEEIRTNPNAMALIIERVAVFYAANNTTNLQTVNVSNTEVTDKKFGDNATIEGKTNIILFALQHSDDPNKLIEAVINTGFIPLNDIIGFIKNSPLIDLSKIETPRHHQIQNIISIEIANLLLQKKLSPDNLLILALKTNCVHHIQNGHEIADNTKLAKRNASVEFALTKGANPDKLLKMAVTQSYTTRTNDNHKRTYCLNIPAADELIKLALKHNASFSEINIENCYRIQNIFSIDTAQIMIENGLTPDNLLVLALKINCIPYIQDGNKIIDNKKIIKRNKLIELALTKGANPNKLIEIIVKHAVDHGGYTRIPQEIELITLATQYKADLSKIKIENDDHLPPPSIELVDSLIKCGLPHNKLLELILPRLVTHEEEKIVALASKHGITFQAINVPELSSENCSKFQKFFSDPIVQSYYSSKYSNPNHIGIDEFSNIDKKIKDSDILLSLIKEHKIDLNQIKYLYSLPSTKTAKFLLENGLNPKKFVSLVSSVLCITFNKQEKKMVLDKESMKHRDHLISLATKKGDRLKEIDDSLIKPILYLTNLITEKGKNNEAIINTLINSITLDDGKTLLMLLSEGGYAGFAKTLIDHGANKNKTDNNGKTAYDLALEKHGNKDPYLIELLRPGKNKPIASIQHICAVCKKPTNFRCSKCQTVYYCSKICQKNAWKEHKKICN